MHRKNIFGGGTSGEKGQGLVEYALILVLVAVVVVVILGLLGPAIGNVFSSVYTSFGGSAAAPSCTTSPCTSWNSFQSACSGAVHAYNGTWSFGVLDTPSTSDDPMTKYCHPIGNTGHVLVTAITDPSYP